MRCSGSFISYPQRMDMEGILSLSLNVMGDREGEQFVFPMILGIALSSSHFSRPHAENPWDQYGI